MTAAVIIISLAFGSFANNVISSFTRKTKFDLFRSYCMCGDRMLKALELIPILSYLFQGGKCTNCSEKIPIRYLIIEITTMVVGFVLYSKYGVSSIFFFALINSFLLLCIAVIDFYSYIIPNLLVLAVLFLSVIKAALLNANIFSDSIMSLSIAVFFILLNYLLKKAKLKEAIGYGDIKLMVAINLFFGYQLFFIGLWLSALIAIPGFFVIKSFSKEHSCETRIPFGFFLSVGFIIIQIFDERILLLFYNL